MPDMTLVILFVVTVPLVFLFIQSAIKLRQDPIRNWLAGMTDPERTAKVTELPSAELPPLGQEADELDKELRQAGYYRKTARKEFLAAKNILVLLPLLLTALLTVVIGPEQEDLSMNILGAGLLITALCWALPRLYLRSQARNRTSQICHALPDALDMTSMCLIGGMSLPDTLTRVGRELFFAHPNLAVELIIIRKQADLSSLEFAFQQFSNRIDAPEVRSLTALINQGQRLGTSIADSVREYADSLRLKWRQIADEQASKVGAKLLFPIVLCLLPSFFILLWGPALLELFSFFQGFDSQIGTP